MVKKKNTRKSLANEARNYMRDKEELLEKASKHILYEIEKLDEAWDNFKPKNYPQAFIEVFLLHSRNLLDFFYPEKSYVEIDDMIVFDFLDNYEDYNINKTLKGNLGFNKKNIHKFLSHLTYTRCFYSEIWLIPKFTEGIINTIRAFYNALPDNYKNWNNFKKIPKLLKSIEEKKKIKTLEEAKTYGVTTSSDSRVTTFGPREL